ncbi:MAG: HlyD family efflux transporter periplasmic adaptor subunit [Phormidium sp.]
MTDVINLTTISESKSKNRYQVNSAFLQTAKADEFLPPISKWAIVGGLLLVGTMGTVKQIAVKENQVVKQGEAIAFLDSSQLLTKKTQLEGNIQNYQLQLNQIAAQINALENQLNAENRAIERTIASAQADLSRKQKEYQEQKTSIITEVQAAEANLKLAESEWQKAQEDLQKEQASLQTVIANLKAAEASLKAAISKQKRYSPLRNSGAISLDLLEEIKLDVDQQKQAFAGQKAALEVQRKVVESQRKTVTRQQQAVAVAKAKLTGVQATLNPSNAAVVIASERIAEEKAKGEGTLANLKQEREALVQRRVEIQNQINRDRQELQQLKEDIKKTIVRSPVTGTIFQLNLRNSGQNVESGTTIAQISPSSGKLIIKAKVAAQDIGKIALGQKSLMRVSAYPYPDYGVLSGKVSAIGPDTVIPQNNTIAQTSSDYEVNIQPEKSYLFKGDRTGESGCCQYPIQPGMEITANIITHQETILSFLLRKARLITDI